MGEIIYNLDGVVIILLKLSCVLFLSGLCASIIIGIMWLISIAGTYLKPISVGH